MLYQFVGLEQPQAFWRAIQTEAATTLSSSAACFALRVSSERLYALVHGNTKDCGENRTIMP